MSKFNNNRTAATESLCIKFFSCVPCHILPFEFLLSQLVSCHSILDCNQLLGLNVNYERATNKCDAFGALTSLRTSCFDIFSSGSSESSSFKTRFRGLSSANLFDSTPESESLDELPLKLSSSCLVLADFLLHFKSTPCFFKNLSRGVEGKP